MFNQFDVRLRWRTFVNGGQLLFLFSPFVSLLLVIVVTIEAVFAKTTKHLHVLNWACFALTATLALARTGFENRVKF